MRWLALIALLGCASAPPPAAAPAPEKKVTMKKYFMAFLRRGPAWTAEQTPEAVRLGEGHMAHIQKMHAAGKLVLAGPFEVEESEKGALAGIYVFDVATLDEARALVNEDPAVQGGRFVPEVLPWWAPAGLGVR